MHIRCLFLAIALFLPLFFSTSLCAEVSKDDCLKDADCVKYYNELGDSFEVLLELRNNYVDKLNFEDLVVFYRQGGLKAVFSSLDPHSVYFTAEEMASQEKNKPGALFGGIGAVISVKNKKIYIDELINDSPASKANLKEGDIISEVCEKNSCVNIDSFNQEAVALLIRGELGTQVTLKLLRKGVDGEISVTLTRSIIRIENVTSKIIGDYGYIRLRQFELNSDDEVYNAYLKLRFIGVKGLIFDVRGNPGGLLSEARRVTALFLERDKLIDKITTRRDTEWGLAFFYKSLIRPTITMPVVVLINGLSASASELFAAALQDHKRAIIVGTPSFGKASMQENREYKGGSYKFTSGRIFRPNGRSLQGKGIWPDFMVSQKNSEEVDSMLEGAYEKKLNKHLKGLEEGILTAEEQAKIDLLRRDTQLETAVEILKVINKGN